jgi:signal transduction histidine kinase/CheY-like chemotaxis protein
VAAAQTILVVNDDSLALKSIQRVLAKAGYAVLAAEDGESALAQVRAHRPSLVLLDVVLPDLRGTEVLRRIRADPMLESVSVVLLSAQAVTGEHQGYGLDCGADGYIVRPLGNAELLARVRAHLRQRERTDGYRTSEARVRKLIEQQVDAVLVVDRLGTIKYANPAAGALFGCRPADLDGAPFGFPVVAGDDTEVQELDISRRDQPPAVTEMRVNAIEWDGEPAWIATLRDITARRLAEQARRESTALLDMASKVARLGAWSIDVVTGARVWSDSTREILDAPPGVTLTVAETVALAGPEHRAAFRASLDACMRNGTSFDIEAEMTTLRQRRLHLRILGEAVRNEANRIVRVQGAFQDVTAERAREAALAEARAHTDRILHIIPGVFYELIAPPGEPFMPVFASDSAATLFGTAVEDAIRHGSLSGLTGVDLPAMRQAALDKAGPSGIAAVEYPVRLPGREIWVRDTMRAILHPDGGRQLVGFIADATAEHAADEARHAAERELRRLNWALAAYSRSLSILIRSETLREVVTGICESIVEEPVYILACFGLAESSPGKPVRWIAGAGSATGYMDALKLSWSEDVPEGRGPTGIAIREGTPQIVRDMDTDPTYSPWREMGQRFGIRSSVTVPCMTAGPTVGALLVYASVPDAFGREEMGLFQRLNDKIGFAMALYEERSRLRAAEAARSVAEDNLHAAVQLGPGVLYRARVTSAGIEMLNLFGEAARITDGITGADGTPATLDTVLGAPAALPALLALTGVSTQTDDYSVAGSDGTTRWLRNVVRLTSRWEDAVEVVGYVCEVTREKQEQLHRQQLATLLTLGEMATGMAHELNQPLTSISFAAQNLGLLIGREPLDLGAANAKVTKIVNEARRASKLVEHMRVFARNEHEAMRPVSWRAVLQSAQEILQPRLRGGAVRDEVPDTLPPVVGAAIPMEQVLINLISNAIDAYETAGAEAPWVVTVWGGVLDGKVVLRVADRAGGIPPHVLSRVFEPFFTTKPPGKGTGLGLALAFGTIIDMGGSITVANENGGAVFEIRLPAADQPGHVGALEEVAGR